VVIDILGKPGAVEEFDGIDAGRAQLLAEILQKAEIRIDYEAERGALAAVGRRRVVYEHLTHSVPDLPEATSTGFTFSVYPSGR